MSEATALPSVRVADAGRSDPADPLRSEIARSDVYRLLAACFCAPHKEALLEAEVPEQLRRAVELVCPAAVEPAARLEEALSGASQAELEIEHARLFVGPGPLPAPPFGSVYLDAERAVMGPSTLEVAALYREAGFEMGADESDPPDHIAAELEFAYLLARETARRLENGEITTEDEMRSLRGRFLRDYLLPWAPSFCDDVVANSENEYFRSLASVLKAFLVVAESSWLSRESQSTVQ